MYKRNCFSSIIFIVLFAFALIESTSFPSSVALYPQMICGVGILFSVWLLAKNAIALKKQGSKQYVDSSLSGRDLKIVGITFLSACVYVFLIQIVGYVVMTFLFVTVFSYCFDSSIEKIYYPIIALLVTTALYAIFQYALNVPLPRGFLI